MLEYFTYKRFKRHQLSKKDRVLSDQDQAFIDKLVQEKSKPAVDPEHTPLPASPDETNGAAPATIDDHVKNGESSKEPSKLDKGKGKAKDAGAKAHSKFKLPALFSKKESKNPPTDSSIPAAEVNSEEKDLTDALDKLGLAAQNDTAFSLSPATKQLLHDFTQVLKDVVNGVPEAGNDLTKLLDRQSYQLDKMWDKLPDFMQDMVKKLPFGLAPELLATASGPPGADVVSEGSKSKKSSFKLPSVHDLVTKPGLVVSILKSALNVLKTRFPAFMGTNALISMGLMVVLMFFWYCHKRGREVRIEKEAKEANMTVEEYTKFLEERDKNYKKGQSTTLSEPMAATPAQIPAAGEPLPSSAAHSQPAAIAVAPPTVEVKHEEPVKEEVKAPHA